MRSRLPNSQLPVGLPIEWPIEVEPDPDLEFHVMGLAFGVPQAISGVYADDLRATNKAIEDYLNDGWQIDEKIICSPLIWLIFSREKETSSDDNKPE